MRALVGTYAFAHAQTTYPDGSICMPYQEDMVWGIPSVTCVEGIEKGHPK